MFNPRTLEDYLKILQNYQKPKKKEDFVNQWHNLLNKIKYQSILQIYRTIRPKPNCIALKDWDKLIILDACRFDIFNNYNKIPGKLSKIISAGSNTPEWLKNNFLNMHMKDVIYISANPYGSYLYLSKNLGHIPFYKIYELWKYDWNDSLGTVLPSKVNEAVKNSIKKHPDKRLLIHYLQPHFPFIGNKNLVLGGMKDIRNDILYNKTWDGNTIWTMFRLGKIDRNTIVNAYIRNLLLVLHYVKDLLPYLQGKVCITSDHGNVFGKFGLFYNHNSGLPLPELIEVPWFEVDLNYYS